MTENNTDTYARMSKPFDSEEHFSATARRFYEGTKQLREACGLQNVYVIMQGQVLVDGEEQPRASTVSFGSSEAVLPMLSWAYGYEQELRQEADEVARQAGALLALRRRAAALEAQLSDVEALRARVAELEKARENG